MALCRFEAKIISRSGGRSTVGAASYRTGKCATSAAAYRAGAQLTDERTGQTYDYTRKRGVMGAEIMLPIGAPEWMSDRGQLWNAVEKAEKRTDAQLARDFILTLPHELNEEQRRELTRDFVRRHFVDKGFAADIAWHAPHGKGDERNHHAHVMVVMRRIEGNGFARTKDRPPDGKHPAEHWKAELRAWREAWANTGADALAKAGFQIEAVRFRLGHLTLEKQREAAIARGDLAWAEILDREVEPKQGPLATKMEREGRESHAGNDRRDVQARNAERAQLKAEHAQVTAQIISLEDERRKREEQKKMSETVELPDPELDDAANQTNALMESFRQGAKAEKDQEEELSARRRREELQTEADDAKRKQKELNDSIAAQIEAGDIADAGTRWAVAIGSTYTVKDPWGSLANAAAMQGAIFARQQEELRQEAAKLAQDGKQEQAELTTMRRHIEFYEYYAFTDRQIMRNSQAFTRKADSENAVYHRKRAEKMEAKAKDIRKERAKLQKEIREREGRDGWAWFKANMDPGLRALLQAEEQREAAQKAKTTTPLHRSPNFQGNPKENRTAEENRIVREQVARAEREGLGVDQPSETAGKSREERMTETQKRERETMAGYYAEAEARRAAREQARNGGRATGRGSSRGR